MPRLTARHWAGTAALATLLVASACGSSSGGAGSSTSTSSSVSSSSSSSTSTSAASSSDTAPSSSTASGAAGSSGTSSATSSGAGGSTLPAAKLTLLFGSSGKAETAAIDAAAAAWGSQSGSTVTATPAQNLTQELAQGFSSNSAPDLFYLGADQVANYAKAGNLLPYGDSLSNKSDFYPALTASFTYDGKLYCAPKDFSTLALWINTDLWTKAGLTDADVPTNWDQLESVAKKLTQGKVAGLSISPERDRLDSFLVQNGSYLVDSAGKPTVNDQKNVDALTYVKKLFSDGSLKTPKDLGAGWAGEAFGKGEAAMTIEGNWLIGALKSDYPTIKAKAYELPAGPTGTKGTLSFTNCWGISATTKYPDQAKAFVEFLTGKDQQIKFSDAFGVIPSIQSAQSDYLSKNPANKPFVDGVSYAKGVLNFPGITDVLDDYNSQLGNLANTDPKTILDSVQTNLQAALGG